MRRIADPDRARCTFDFTSKCSVSEPGNFLGHSNHGPIAESLSRSDYYLDAAFCSRGPRRVDSYRHQSA